MAGNALIGSLRVSLGLDSAEFQNGARKAQGTLAGLSSSIKGFAAGAIAALSFGAVASAVKSTVNHMDELGKASQRIGIPIEQLSGLEYAARLSDVSLGDLETTVTKFSKSLAQISAGGSNDAGAALRALGVSAVDANGKLRPTQDIISDVAARFYTMKDGAEKTALAVALFGKSGAAMIPLLNGGRDAITGASEEARKFGLIVTEQAAFAAEQFNDNLTRLKGASEGLTNQIAQAMLPAMVDITNAMVDFAAEGTIAEQLTKAIAFVMRESAKFILEASAAWQEITTWIDAAGKSLDALSNGDLTGAANAWAKASTDVSKIWEGVAERVKQIDGLVQSSNVADKESLPSARRRYDAPVMKTASGVPAIKRNTGGASQSASGIPDLSKEVEAATRSLENLKREGQSVWESTRTPLEKYKLEIRKLNELMQAGAIDHETYSRAVLKLQNEFSSTAQSVKKDGSEIFNVLQSSMSSWIDDALAGTFKLKDALKGLLKSFADLAIKSAFAPAAGGAGGGGFLSTMIGGLFGGLTGFASGGSIMPGGSGGIDSQLVAFRKSPNERVDISKPGQNVGGTQQVDVMIRLSDDLVGMVDQKVNAGMRQAVNVSVAQSGMQAKKNFGALAAENNIRSG